jgi:hypothetical protein
MELSTQAKLALVRPAFVLLTVILTEVCAKKCVLERKKGQKQGTANLDTTANKSHYYTGESSLRIGRTSPSPYLPVTRAQLARAIHDDGAHDHLHGQGMH